LKKQAVLTDINKIRQALLSFNEETLFGKIRFDSTGKVVGKGMPVIQILKGTQRTVYPDNVAETKPVYPKPAWR